MSALVRTIIYATIFVALVLVFVPARLLEWSGIVAPASWGLWQIIGAGVVVLGAALALWCVLAFGTIGQGTPAPFDPPRKLVVRGPYRYVRNPMYIGAGGALGGAALYYQSWQLAGYTAFLFLATHIFINLYEEPTLKRLFGKQYEDYCRKVRRWRPSFSPKV